jgi:hypothetical protein
MIPKLKYIAAYQTNPVSAITHVAPVASIEPYGEDSKYKLISLSPRSPLGRFPRGGSLRIDARLALQDLCSIDGGEKIADLFPK